MSKLVYILIGILTGIVIYFGVFDVQALRIPGFPYGWFVSPVGYIVLGLIMIGLFFLTRMVQNKITHSVIRIVVYAILTFILFALFFPGYIFY
ncbi:MAG: hypothetical protein HYT67_02190 [Candidatus Yanofskybacteria bacterium]|nr:hypothetical protein [Candidatus Yanofskybacteria bacterium]